MAIDFKPPDKATFDRFKNRTFRPDSKDYWTGRAFRAEAAADKTAAELLRDMAEVYRKSLAELEREIHAFYGRYAEENGLDMAEVHKRLDPRQLKSAREEIKRYYEFADPKRIGRGMSREYRDELRRLSARAYMSRLEEIKAGLKHIVVKLAAEERAAYEKALKEVYAEAHAQTAYTVDKGLGFSEGYSAPDGDALTKAVSEKWLGSNYSDRIWQDKGKLLTAIENELLSGIAQGHNPRKIAAAMSDRYGMDYRSCERLARTETIHTLNRAAYDSYREHGVERYRFVCGLDERTCPTCGALDGTVHDMKYAEEGVNFPVMHPNCFSDDTKVLTLHGWKLFRDCNDDDTYFSVNPADMNVTACLLAVKRIAYQYSGDMYTFSGKDMSVRCTANHNMFVCSENGDDFHFVKADTVKTGDFFFANSPVKVDSITREAVKNEWVYCVELVNWHTLLVSRKGSTGVWAGNCRCSHVPEFGDEISRLFDDGGTTRLAYDKERRHYDVPASMTYKEWRAMVAEKN